MPTPYQYLLPTKIVISLSCLGIFALFVFLFLPVIFTRYDLRHKKEAVYKIGLVVGVVLGACIFWVNTSVSSSTSGINPPHGVTYGLWDEDPSRELYGGIALFYGEEFLAIGSEDWPAQRQAINSERFLRYFLPPPFRTDCYSQNTTGCMWGDVDINNYDIRMQWREYLIRLGIGIICGIAAYGLILLRYKRLSTKNHFETAG